MKEKNVIVRIIRNIKELIEIGRMPPKQKTFYCVRINDLTITELKGE